MVQLPPSSLQPVLDDIALYPRRGSGLPVRVEQRDGTTIEGLFEPKTSGISLLIEETQSFVDVPLDTVRRLWVLSVLRSRQRIYLAFAVLTAAGVGIVSVQLAESEALPGILLGIAVWLALILWAWFPPVRGWMVHWQLRYVASDANGANIVS